MENYTIVTKCGTRYYDTDDEKFYPDSWDRTFDKKKYLKTIMANNPDKFEGCKIESNN